MTFAPPNDPAGPTGDMFTEYPTTIDRADRSTSSLLTSTTAFTNAITKAFSQATAGGKQFDDVLKQLALRLSSMAVTNAFKPLINGAAGSLSKIMSGQFDGAGDPAAQSGGVKLFASGGVIGAPTYFPLQAGGLGLAGEAGPEAIMPLARGADGKLGVAMAGGGAVPNVTVQIATPDIESFRRSEAYITGQIARAVARGQRSL